MRAIYLFFAGSVFLCFLTVSGCVSMEQHQSLENRVISLEQETSRQVALSRQQAEKDEQLRSMVSNATDRIASRMDEKTGDLREQYADTMARIQELTQEIQRLKGMIEEADYQVQHAGGLDQEGIENRLNRLDNAITRNFERIIVLEKYMGFEPSVESDTVPDEGALRVPTDQDATESELYTAAKKLLDEGDTENARIQFENFINRFPDSKNADNARFWIADSYFTDKWYEKAILEYQKVIEQYPDSNKIQAALLKQGYAFAELGEKANARLILQELINKYPDSNEAGYAAEKLKTLN
jgi:tol-pal system protein YbgF